MEPASPPQGIGEDSGANEMPEQDAPRQGYHKRGLCSKDDLLFHRNILLGHILLKLKIAFDETRISFTKESKALLKVRMERANQESVDIKGCAGREEDVRKTYALLNELEEVIIVVTAFLNLQEAGKTKNGTTANQEEPISRRCAFKNCKSSEHFTNQCNKNLGDGRTSDNIIKLCTESRVCTRCLRALDFWNHDGSCSGSYVRRRDKKWVKTDCDSCFIRLPGGATINLNRRICYHGREDGGTEGTNHFSQDEESEEDAGIYSFDSK